MERPIPSSIPTTPGVYIYKDAGGRIIYVGKARDLRRRVLSYFRPADQITPKTAAMLSHAESLEFLTVATEKEALLLEASLIKKHRPRYNICLRDDKQYVMFRLSMKMPFPRLEIVRRIVKRDGAQYFGPFTSGTAARETWKALHRIFPLRRCSDRALQNRQTPCLYHHINLCQAPCAGLITQHAYAELCRKVALLLSGKSNELTDILRQEMNAAAEALEFERAADIRDQLKAIKKTIEAQGIVMHGGSDTDAAGIVVLPDGLALGIVFVRNGLVQDRTTFFWPGLGLEDAPELLASFICQFYTPGASIPARIVLPFLPWNQNTGLRSVDSEIAVVSPASSIQLASPFIAGSSSTPCFFQHGNPPSSKENPSLQRSPMQPDAAASSSIQEKDAGLTAIELASRILEKSEDCQEDDRNSMPLLEENSREALEAALSELRGGQVHITTPHSAEDVRLLDMARSNARESAIRKKERPLAEMLSSAFRANLPIVRIECADVSHTGGEQTKVGVVVYEDGHPRKEDYRVWNIEDAGGDDYLALSEWARRRASQGEPWPDLLLIDGGRGQVNAVDSVFRTVLEADDHGRLPFLLAGIAKARDERGHADRRAGNIADRIFLPGRSNPLPIKDGSPELLFLQAVRDAAHDFSIGRHRQARARHAFDGELRSMPGIGTGTARLLWEHFNSIAAMKAASIDELCAIPGIGPKKADAIRKALSRL